MSASEPKIGTSNELKSNSSLRENSSNNRYHAPHLSEFYSIVNNENQRLPTVNENNNSVDELVSSINDTDINGNSNKKESGFNPFTKFTSRFSSRRPSSVTSGMSSISDLRTLVTKKDMDNTAIEIEKLYKNSKSYSSKLVDISTESSELACSLEAISKLKGCSDVSADKLLKASGLFHLLANHEQIMSRIINDLLNENILQELTNFKEENKKLTKEFKNNFMELSSSLKLQEKRNAELSKKKIRNILTYRQSLNNLQFQLDQVETLKHHYFQDCYKLVEDTCNNVLKNVASTTRAQVEISENIARKGWSGGGLDNLLSDSNDPFNYESDEEDEEFQQIKNNQETDQHINGEEELPTLKENIVSKIVTAENNGKIAVSPKVTTSDVNENKIVNENPELMSTPHKFICTSDNANSITNENYITSPLKNETKDSDTKSESDQMDNEEHEDVDSNFDNSFSLPIMPPSRNTNPDHIKSLSRQEQNNGITSVEKLLLPGTNILSDMHTEFEKHERKPELENEQDFGNTMEESEYPDFADQSTIHDNS
ncbi:hypothetical protein TPHA_0C01970 [Tetrapisispora phaffii CBS 4417]|uniref:Protein IVY1 n=1 Tax=Tetrapisispora phaffii (strain ATCC 24235 / CBS 4417 / NBRC 1672 / NRRL Y-8282 / UCD 70-5) TaxID=1071381 RepID=G8BRH6_TETPH|nr:hypothetical protein TPHA_0C01970 [Tetrapisispora phaffii CBS 4417]CCE62352.1 hypothetical protein TPHA_0C01970 [Tetrapisispora phaffii CBS 4417]